MPYCHLPWTNIDISPMGEMKPCCKFMHSSYAHTSSNIGETNIEGYLNSLMLKEVKKDFLQNKWPKGCERCKIEEENGIESKRIQGSKLLKERLGPDYPSNGFVTASIAFGNTCNLKCIMCSPVSSSKWREEWKEVTGDDIKPNHFYKSEFVDNFYKFAKNLIHLDIPGGEPFISGVEQQKELLKHYVQDKRAKDISLHYNTNCTVFPDEYWIELWKHFKNVDIQLSIDGIGSKFEYIRFPGKWDTIIENTKKYVELVKTKLPNARITAFIAVSAYNIAYLDELIFWLESMGIVNPSLGRVDFPTHFRPTVWRDNAKQFIIQRLSESKYNLDPFISLMKNEDMSKNFDLFRYRVLRHDNYRKTKFKETFPEMFEFLKD